LDPSEIEICAVQIAMLPPGHAGALTREAVQDLFAGLERL
jgi:hypothetical protein